MDYPKRIDTISKEMSILYFKGLAVKLLSSDVFLPLKINFISANSADPDLGPHCLANNLLTNIQNKK